MLQISFIFPISRLLLIFSSSILNAPASRNDLYLVNDVAAYNLFFFDFTLNKRNEFVDRLIAVCSLFHLYSHLYLYYYSFEFEFVLVFVLVFIFSHISVTHEL